MKRSFYEGDIAEFCGADPHAILGAIVAGADGGSSQSQQNAWMVQIEILQGALAETAGGVFFEYAIPRMGTRIDVVVLMGPVIFVLEFKVGAEQSTPDACDQAWDYALDLNYFHEQSHGAMIAPVVIPTQAADFPIRIQRTHHKDALLVPMSASPAQLRHVVDEVLRQATANPIDPLTWRNGRYSPTPTIIEAATALYRGHHVAEISRSDAAATNLTETTNAIDACIRQAREGGHKAICLVTGVPGAGKTLVGLNIATKHLTHHDNTYSVFLSGNGPLVNVLQEALALDHVARAKDSGDRITRREARSRVKTFIQNVHHYRDEYLRDPGPPFDHVALFDEAQRAWDLEQTSRFMAQKKKRPNFNQSEPEFLISCIDRHPDWGAIVCLVGGGQEIHTGEAGIGEWIAALNRSFPHWHVHISSRLTDTEYGAGAILKQLAGREHVRFHDNLHLGVSMRSFRAEHLSTLVKHLLDLELDAARDVYQSLAAGYPILLTRDVAKAKDWLRAQARGSERYGMVVSSQAERLKPYAIDVKSPMNPVHWFLHGKDDVRSSYYLEHVATEFSIQGLELDWVGMTWDADFRHLGNGWDHLSFRGSRWTQIRKPERKTYLKNAYRVLLTRARQGMVIVVPEGDRNDPTRHPDFYDPTFAYLKSVGFQIL